MSIRLTDEAIVVADKHKLSWTGLILLIVIVATVLRIASAVAQGNSVDTLPGIHDQVSYHTLAQRLLSGHGFSFGADHWPATRAGEPTAHWSFLYTSLLSGIYAIFGPHPVAARVLQALVAGILHTWLTWRIGRRVFGKPVGAVAAALSAVYVYFVYYAGALVTETLYIVSILWVIDCALRLTWREEAATFAEPSSKSRWLLWAELGLAVGVTVLLRQVFVLLVPLLYVWLWWSNWRTSSSEGRPRWRSTLSSALVGTALSASIVAIMILPWTIRNYRVFDTFVPLNTNSGYAFYWGNHPIHGTSFVPILPESGPSYLDLLPRDLLHLNEAELDSALLKQGLGFVAADPVRYVRLSISRSQEYFKFWPSAESGLVSNIARVASFGLLLPFLIYGLSLAARQLRRPASLSQQSAIVLLFGFCVSYVGIHLLTWALIRYRIPVDAVFVIFAAFGLVDLAKRVAGQRLLSPEDADSRWQEAQIAR